MISQQKTAASGMVVFIWLLFGGLVGLATGYFGYVRQTPLFESSARIQIRYAESTEADSQNDFDESAIIVGRPVVASAVQEFQLARLAELRDGDSEPSQDHAINRLLTGGRLSAKRIAGSRQGSIYEIAFRGSTPSSSRKVVEAMIAACAKTMPEAGDRDNWDESLRLLSQSREETSAKIDDLVSQLEQVEAPLTTVLRDSHVISSDSVRWEILQQDLDGNHATLARLRIQIGGAESMIAQGASPDAIIKYLQRSHSQPMRVATNLDGLAGETQMDPLQRQQQFLERTKKADQELAPLEFELSKLLERYGASHPTVMAIRRKMDAVRSKYGVVEEQKTPLVALSENLAGIESDEEKLAAVDSLLQQLREERAMREHEVDDLLAQLDETATKMATEDRLRRKQELLRQQIQRQQEFESEILARLTQLSDVSPFSKLSLQVLVPPEAGGQVEPRLMPSLFIGSVIGSFAGIVIGLLLMLAAAMGDIQEISVSDDAEPAGESAL